MDKKQLLDATALCRLQLAKAIRKFVIENGTMCTKEDIENFGLDAEEGEVRQIYSFHDNDGCSFIEDVGINQHCFDGINDANWYDKLYEGVTYTKYMCLYTLRTPLGYERLCFCRFYNGGFNLDENTERDYGDVQSLPLLDLDYIIHAIYV